MIALKTSRKNNPSGVVFYPVLRFWRYFLQILTHHDVKRLRRAMTSVGTESFFDNLKRLLRGKLRCDTFLLMRFDQNAAPSLLGSWILRDHLPQSALDQYIDGAYRLDPFFQYQNVPKAGAFYRLIDIAPDRFFSSEYYLQYYKLTRLCDEIGLLVPLPNGSRIHLSFSRLETRGPFRRKELQCLDRYCPILLEMLSAHGQLSAPFDQLQKSDKTLGPLHEIIRRQVHTELLAELTQREAQIAALVLQGHSNGSAALTLGISKETIKVHRRNLYRKLHISSPRELFSMLKHLL